jgi:hypothetical protein
MQSIPVNSLGLLGFLGGNEEMVGYDANPEIIPGTICGMFDHVAAVQSGRRKMRRGETHSCFRKKERTSNVL